MAAPELKVVAPKQYDVSQKVTASPLYTWYDVYPRDGSQTGTINATSVHVKSFDIPAGRLLNLSRSVLRCEFKFTSSNADYWTKIMADTLPIANIRLMTRQGTDLLNIAYGQDYHKLVCLPSVSSSMDHAGPFLPDDGEAANYITGRWRPGKNIHSYTTGRTEGKFAEGLAESGAATPSLGVDGVAVDDTLCDTTATVQSVAHAAEGKDVVALFELPLGDLVGTVCCYDKSLMFSEILELRVEFAAHSSYAFEVKETTDYKDSGGSSWTGTISTLTSVTYSDMRLQLCMDENKAAVNTWLERIQSEAPFECTIPFTTMVNLNLGSSVTAQQNTRINRAHGSSLLRIHAGVRRALTTHATGYRYYARSDAAVAVYQTMLNSQPLQPKQLDTSKLEDWEWNRDLVKGSLLGDAPTRYQGRIPVHIDQFGSDGESVVNAPVSDFYRSGMPLDTEITYTYFASTKYAHNHDLLLGIVAQKTLSISRLGVAVI